MQIEVTRALSAAQGQRWAAFLDAAATAHPEQDPRFAPVHRAEGKEVAFVLGSLSGQLRAVALFALTPHPFLPGRFADAMAFSGPVCDSEAEMMAFLDALRLHPVFRKVGRLRITPYWLDDGAKALGRHLQGEGWRVFEAEPIRHTGRIDLRPDPEAIFQSYSKSVRDQIRKAAKLGLQADQATSPGEALEFLASVNRHRGERGMAGLSPAYMLALQEAVLPGNALAALQMVRHGSDLVGGILTFCGPVSAHSLYMSTDVARLKALGNLRIVPFLCHNAALWARSRGALWLDLEGFKPDAAEDDRLYRIYRYKADLAVVHALRVAGHGLVLNPFLHLTGNARDLARGAVRRMRQRLRRPSAQPARAE